MAIAITLHDYLKDHEIDYDLVPHTATATSTRTAEVSHVPRRRLAKGVVIKTKKGFLMAVVPASHHVALRKLGSWLKRPVCLATEEETARLFEDCEVGAIPPIGAAYGLRTVMDERLSGKMDIYFEGGDHRTLVHIPNQQFDKLMKKTPHHRFSRDPKAAQGKGVAREEHYWGA